MEDGYDQDMNYTLAYECSRTTLGVLLSLFLYFYKTQTIWFYPRSLDCLVSGS